MKPDPRLARLELVYRDRFGKFVRLAMAILGEKERARDVVQEAFLRAVRARASLRDLDAAESWVAQIVVNCARDARRDLEAVDDAVTEEQTTESTLGDDSLRAAVALLPERQRVALFLRYYADFDYRQIAAALDVEVGTVSATLHAARAAVARILEEVRT